MVANQRLMGNKVPDIRQGGEKILNDLSTEFDGIQMQVNDSEDEFDADPIEGAEYQTSESGSSGSESEPEDTSSPVHKLSQQMVDSSDDDPPVEQIRGLPRGRPEAAATPERNIRELVKNDPYVQQMVKDMVVESIKEERAKQSNAKGNSGQPVSGKSIVRNHVPEEIRFNDNQAGRIKLPSDTTLYTPALKQNKDNNFIIDKISNFVESVRMEQRDVEVPGVSGDMSAAHSTDQ